MRLVLRPIGDPAGELLEVTTEPIPRSLATYFEVRSFAFADRPTLDRLPVSVRLVAVGNELRRKLTLMSDLVRRLEALEWQVRLVGDEVWATTGLSTAVGWQTLQQQGIADHLLPLLQKGSDLPPRGMWPASRRVRPDPKPAPGA